MVVKIKAIANKFGRTDQWLRNIIGKGFVPEPVKGHVDFEAAAIGIFNFEEDKVAKAEGARAELAKSRAAVANEDAEWKRIRRMKASGEMVELRKVEMVWTARKVALRQRIEQFPLNKREKEDLLDELENAKLGEIFKE